MTALLTGQQFGKLVSLGQRAVAFPLNGSMSHIKLFDTELCATFQNCILLTAPSLKISYKSHILYMKLSYLNCF